MKTAKTCSTCGKIHNELPATFRIATGKDMFEGIYFECDQCQSTLFIPKEFKSVKVKAA